MPYSPGGQRAVPADGDGLGPQVRVSAAFAHKSSCTRHVGLAFAVWDDGKLVRSLSLSPDSGIIEDIGERLPFELPYWEGRQPVEPFPPFEDEDPYPLPFHPLELGERALLEFFGFYVEGSSDEDDAPEPAVDIWDVELHGFRVTATRQDEATD